ncbi:MAG: hypothetical protein V3U74_05620 [Thermodesulfobacteriota bacterium]
MIRRFRTGSSSLQINALVLDEAKEGYRLVAVNTDRLKVGQVCRVKVGKFPPIEAEVV